MEKGSHWPRISNGPDLTKIVMGSEGNLGIVTEAVIRLRPLPEVVEYQSIVFPDYQHGIKFIEDVAKSRIWPASVRVIDEIQFKAAFAIKEKGSIFTRAFDALADFYLSRIKGFDLNKMAACTMMFEGTKEEVERQKKSINRIYPKYHGVIGGAENGQKGYYFIFAIAYIRDFLASLGNISESMEMAVPFSKLPTLVENVKARFFKSVTEKGFDPKKCVFSSRVT